MEHRNAPAGERHGIANWTVDSIAARNVLSVALSDEGKVCWVRGVGHYVLATASPVVWELITVNTSLPEYATFAAFTAARVSAPSGQMCVLADETNGGGLTFYMYHSPTDKLHWIPTVEV